MYPYKFESIYFEKIWGSDNIKEFRDDVEGNKIGESWDISGHKNGTSIVANGKHKGKNLLELIEIEKEKFMGSKISLEEFPLLLKIIDSAEALSIQVHPSDDYIGLKSGENGKTEAWYILDAEEGSEIIVGTKDCSRKEFFQALDNKDLEDKVNRVKVKKGDVFYIKTGLIHSIGKGITLVEIQQSSDTTYRVYDFGRDRELHIEEAKDVIDFDLISENRRGIEVKEDGYIRTYYCLGEYFSLEKIKIDEQAKLTSDEERFYIYTCIDGSGKVIYDEGKVDIKYGESFIIPAMLGEYEIEGNIELLVSYVPDVNRIERKILEEIR